jgi:hypothetical protein
MGTDEQLEMVLGAAKRHGEDSEPEHEVGDLQDVVWACWEVMTEDQRHQVLKAQAVADIFDSAYGEDDGP